MISNEYFNIMTFDGGGLRGALSITLVERFYRKYPYIIEKTNMFGGTSTGSLIALGLAYGLNVSQIKELYSYENSKYIFDNPYTQILRPKYDNDNLKKMLCDSFHPDLRLKDLGKLVVIPTFYVGDKDNSWKPIFYNNIPGSDTENAKVIDVAMASCAAPVFFPSYKKHVDGGVIGGDPTFSCVVHTLDKCINRSLQDIRALSVGTGSSYMSITEDTTNWGAMDWVANKDPGLPILSIMLEGNIEVSKLFADKLLGENYHRIDPELKIGVGMDDYEKLDYIISLGKNLNIDNTLRWIGEKW